MYSKYGIIRLLEKLRLRVGKRKLKKLLPALPSKSLNLWLHDIHVTDWKKLSSNFNYLYICTSLSFGSLHTWQCWTHAASVDVWSRRLVLARLCTTSHVCGVQREVRRQDSYRVMCTCWEQHPREQHSVLQSVPSVCNLFFQLFCNWHSLFKSKKANTYALEVFVDVAKHLTKWPPANLALALWN